MLGAILTAGTGLAKSVFGGIIGTRNAYKGNAENELVRQSESFNSARGFKPEGWLGKQIRPVITAVVVSPLLLITIIICIMITKIVMPVLNNATDIPSAIVQIKTMFTLYDGLSDRYWDLTQIVVIFWFGGRMQKYLQNHIETKHVIKSSTNDGNSLANSPSPSNGSAGGNGDNPALKKINDIMDRARKEEK